LSAQEIFNCARHGNRLLFMVFHTPGKHTYPHRHPSLLSIIENLSKLWPVIDFNGFSICPCPQIKSTKNKDRKNKCTSKH